MAKTIVGLYDDRRTAERVIQDLESRGFGKEHLRFTSREDGSSTSYDVDPDKQAKPDALADHGIPRDEAEFYCEGVRRGGSLVIARTHDSDAEAAADIMARHNPARYEDRRKSYEKEGFKGYDEKSKAYSPEERQKERSRYADENKQRLQEIEEHLKIGKREAVRGGVRAHQVVETGQEQETLRLREEHVDVDRKDVNRKVSSQEADAAFEDRTVEMVERSEEAVVEKEAFVTGEVSVGKDVSTREETVGGEVRRTRVEIEKIPAETFSKHDEAFRQHHQQQYKGQDYDQYQQAYQYGYAAGETYRDRDFNQVEGDLQRDYSDRYGDRNAWQKTKDAVRHGYNRARGKA